MLQLYQETYNMVLVTSPALCPIAIYPTRPHTRRLHRTQFSVVSSFQISQNSSETGRRCDCFDIYKERIPYLEALSWQKFLVKERKTLMERNLDSSDMLIVLQHPPVYTLGTGSSEDYINFDVNNSSHDFYRTDRGGEVTYHGPGQLIMYPIINLRYHTMDLHWYLRALEEVIIRVLDTTFSIKASRIDGLTGVWIGNEKLAAIGIKVSKWITHHGLALNVTTDLTPFQQIVPCGIRDRQVGSIKGLLGDSSSLGDCELIDITHNSLLKEFSEVFQLELCHVPMPMSNLSDRENHGMLV